VNICTPIWHFSTIILTSTHAHEVARWTSYIASWITVLDSTPGWGRGVSLWCPVRGNDGSTPARPLISESSILAVLQGESPMSLDIRKKYTRSSSDLTTTLDIKFNHSTMVLFMMVKLHITEDKRSLQTCKSSHLRLKI